MKKFNIIFPTYNVSLGEAISIVRNHLNDTGFAHQSKLLAIQKVAEMETHNSIRKDDLLAALRWLFDNYEF